MKRTVIVILVVCSLLLSTAGAALAGSKLGTVMDGATGVESPQP